MNALEAKIHRIIEAEGPISVALYMALCLGDSEHGYYMRQEAFGTKGDFVTAPEVSQLFGEIIGVFFALCLDQFEADTPITLAELGPGRGALMKDILRSLKQLRPKHFNALNVALVETSPRLRALQVEAIAPLKVPVFHNTIDSLPANTPLLVVGNEFLDALPIRQYIKNGALWSERMVTVETGKLAFATGSFILAPNQLPPHAAFALEGTVFEISAARTAVVENLAHRLKAQGGMALFLDYGHLQTGFGDTFQALRAHDYAPVLEAPGEVDLTSHVDFEALARAVNALGGITGSMVQREFLLNLGLLERAGALGAGKSVEFQSEIQAAVERLAGAEAMGDLFKVLSFASHSNAHLPPPFETAYAGQVNLPV